MTKIQRWGYYTQRWDYINDSMDNFRQMERDLEELGEDGWELVNFTGSGTIRAIFKRPLEN